MASSDWLQIVLSIVGVLIGAIISYIFFRAQQVTDFNHLRAAVDRLGTELDKYQKEHSDINLRTMNATEKMNQTVTETVATLGRARQLFDIAERLESRDEITSIRATVEKINSNLDSAVTSILSGIRDQQAGLSVSIQRKFDEQAKIAVRVVEESIQKELSNLVTSPKERANLKSKFVDLIEQAINRMGEFQRINIEHQSNTLLITVEQQVKGAVKEVVEGVTDLKDKIDSTLALAASPQSELRGLGSGEM